MALSSPGNRSSSELRTPAALHILMVLAEGERHGYGIKQALENQTEGRLRLGPGTLYEALYRLADTGWIEEVEDSGAPQRRRVYRITAAGRRALRAELAQLETIVIEARARKLLPGTRASRT